MFRKDDMVNWIKFIGMEVAKKGSSPEAGGRAGDEWRCASVDGQE